MYEVGGEEARPKKKEENSMVSYEDITIEIGFWSGDKTRRVD